jgi:integrase/recombinase XerD
VTLGKEWVVKGVVSPKKEIKLPVIPSRAKVTQFLEAITSLKHRAILMTAYAAGLRGAAIEAALRIGGSSFFQQGLTNSSRENRADTNSTPIITPGLIAIT